MSGSHQMLLGAGGPADLLNAQNANANTSTVGSNAVSSISFNSAGTCTRAVNGHTTFNWLLGGSSAAYDIRFTGTQTGVGTLGGLAVGAWGNLSLNRAINLTRTTTGVVSFSGTYDIALAGTTTPLKSGTLSLTSTRN